MRAIPTRTRLLGNCRHIRRFRLLVLGLLGTVVLDYVHHLVPWKLLSLLMELNLTGARPNGVALRGVETFLQCVQLLIKLEVLGAVGVVRMRRGLALELGAGCVGRTSLSRAYFRLGCDDLLLALALLWVILLEGGPRRRFRVAIVEYLATVVDLSMRVLGCQSGDKRIARVPVGQLLLLRHLLLLSVGEHLLATVAIVHGR